MIERKETDEFFATNREGSVKTGGGGGGVVGVGGGGGGGGGGQRLRWVVTWPGTGEGQRINGTGRRTGKTIIRRKKG